MQKGINHDSLECHKMLEDILTSIEKYNLKMKTIDKRQRKVESKLIELQKEITKIYPNALLITNIAKEYNAIKTITLESVELLNLTPALTELVKTEDREKLIYKDKLATLVKQRCQNIMLKYNGEIPNMTIDSKSEQEREQLTTKRKMKKRKKSHNKTRKRKKTKKLKKECPQVTPKLLARIRNKKSGAKITCGWMTVMSVDEPYEGDYNTYQYINVNADDIPLRKTRVKVDLPWESHISKDILVRKNRFQIRDGRVFNNTKTGPRYATFKIGQLGVEILKDHKDYTPFEDSNEDDTSETTTPCNSDEDNDTISSTS